MANSSLSSPRHALQPTIQEEKTPEQSKTLPWYRPARWLNGLQLVTRSELDMLVFSTAIKLLLFPS